MNNITSSQLIKSIASFFKYDIYALTTLCKLKPEYNNTKSNIEWSTILQNNKSFFQSIDNNIDELSIKCDNGIMYLRDLRTLYAKYRSEDWDKIIIYLLLYRGWMLNNDESILLKYADIKTTKDRLEYIFDRKNVSDRFVHDMENLPKLPYVKESFNVYQFPNYIIKGYTTKDFNAIKYINLLGMECKGNIYCINTDLYSIWKRKFYSNQNLSPPDTPIPKESTSIAENKNSVNKPILHIISRKPPPIPQHPEQSHGQSHGQSARKNDVDNSLRNSINSISSSKSNISTLNNSLNNSFKYSSKNHNENISSDNNSTIHTINTASNTASNTITKNSLFNIKSTNQQQNALSKTQLNNNINIPIQSHYSTPNNINASHKSNNANNYQSSCSNASSNASSNTHFTSSVSTHSSTLNSTLNSTSQQSARHSTTSTTSTTTPNTQHPVSAHLPPRSTKKRSVSVSNRTSKPDIKQENIYSNSGCYLLQEEVHRLKKDNIYKIGKAGHIKQRLVNGEGYRNASIICILEVKDEDACEKEIIKTFDEKFIKINTHEDGTKTFERYKGDIDMMRLLFIQICLKYV